MQKVDFIVIGAGISGASAAYYLSQHGSTILLEKESVPGYHATGRSAALFSDNHGPSIVCKLARASLSFLSNPPSGFTNVDILTDRGVLFTGTNDEHDIAKDMCSSYFEEQSEVHLIDTDQAKNVMPFVKDEYLQSAALYEEAKEIDVAALHQGFLTGAKKHGCTIKVSQNIKSIEQTSDGWIIKTKTESYQAKKIINAAGAWADQVAELAGINKIGLVPKRRTVITIDLPEEYIGNLYPMTIFHDQKLYFKTENAQVLISPMDMTPSEPADSIAEEYDIAVASHLFEERTGITVKKITNKWAGLRSFVEDGIPVLEDINKSGFIWLAGQGGYGIKISEAMGRITTAIALEQNLPEDIISLGLSLDDLSSARLTSGIANNTQTKIA